MTSKSNPLNTIILALLLLVMGDLFLNDGRILLGVIDKQGTAVQAQQQQPLEVWTMQADNIVEVTATPVINNLVPVQPTAAPTYTPYPTYTPAPLFNAYSLPPMGPYSLEQVETCRNVINQNMIDTMPSPQRELCENYIGLGK